MIDATVPSEILEPAEVAKITGCKRRAGQLAWLAANAWPHRTNKAGWPIVGRLAARLLLAGAPLSAVRTPTAWQPNFDKLQ
jgi:Domain of unknown function (DUF4224)